MRSFLAFTLVATAMTVGCAKTPPAKDTTDLSSARAPKRNVVVADDLLKACKIQLSNAEHAPKFDFDDADLLPEDRDVLEQIARCVTTGPLKGRALNLVGRCDPRGEVEYNMVLGDYRAESVSDYLARLGVDPAAMARTTRGDLDAEGKDEDGWQRDRRVDISLQPTKQADTGIAKR
jgi:peptidoglycan-associated lipoprotein